MKIPGCSYSTHSDVKLERPKVQQAEQVDCTSRPVIIEPAIGTVDPIPTEVKPQIPFVAPSGMYKCRHAGCQREYDPASNTEESCEYHEGSAGFRDTRKFWTCCGASSYDWDEFMKIPKCKKGPHEPKMIDAPS